MDDLWARRTTRASDGVELAVYEGGVEGAPVVLFVHGYPDEHSVWDLVAAELAEDHRLVAFDVRGAGRSETPGTRSGWRMGQLLDDISTVIGVVADGTGVHLVGHDWGSIQCWSFVLHPVHRDLASSFTSMCGPSLHHVERKVHGWIRGGPSGWAAATRQAGSSAYIGFFQMPVAPWLWRRIGPWWASLLAWEVGDTDGTWPVATVGEDAARGVELYRAQRRAMLPPLRSDRLPPADAPTDVPVSLLVSSDDPFISTSLIDGLEELALDCVRRDVSGGHWLPRTSPHEIAATVRDRTHPPAA